MRVRGFAVFVASTFVALTWLACGARTGLLLDDPTAKDGGSDTGGRSAELPDSGRAGSPIRDAAPDAPPDAPVVTDCANAGVTYIYLMTDQRELLSFYPPTGAFRTIGSIACPAVPGESPFSMAVDRSGQAYVLFTDGELFEVSTRNASCRAIPFRVGQQGFVTFGMGFASNPGDGGETLYVDQIDHSTDTPSSGLASIDLQTYQLHYIGPFGDATLAGGELTGTGDSQLFGYFFHLKSDGGTLLQIDRQSGKTISATQLPIGNNQSSEAFAFWGGDFYIFTSPDGGPTMVTRYSPSSAALVTVAHRPGRVVGAGVSTCAPQH
ncbi:MAG: hypothetical protein ABI548_06085 [Polyangiaceae bacterium]